MSMVMELIRAVTSAERQIDDQIGKLQSYIGEIDGVINQTNAALDGSTQNYGQQMIQQLTATKTQVQQAIGKLQAAKDKLLRVKTI